MLARQMCLWVCSLHLDRMKERMSRKKKKEKKKKEPQQRAAKKNHKERAKGK